MTTRRKIMSVSACLILAASAILFATNVHAQEPKQPDLRLERQSFQRQELITSNFGGWVFQVGTTPKLIWRDIREVERLGNTSFTTRWFNTNLEEKPEPDEPGRWMAWLEGTAPNGTPFRRSFTFYVFPKQINNSFAPDLTIEFPNFPDAKTPKAWAEHKFEFDQLGKDMMIRALLDSEKGAILIAGIAESQLLRRQKRYIESTSVVNDEKQLALKLKVLGLENQVRSLKPPQSMAQPTTIIRNGTHLEAGIPNDAKEKIDAFCKQWAKATGEPFVTLVARNGVIITHEAFGVSPNGAPVDLDYRCWVASITKTITALMFSQFVDQDLIRLDDKVSSVFPDYPADSPNVPTFGQLLNHTSGLAGPNDFGGMKNPNFENVVLNGIDVNEPGKEFAYTGMGFELAAKAMEIKTGKCAAKIYHDHFFSHLNFGDFILGNASSDGQFTAKELAILAQWVANQGSYGNKRFIQPSTFSELLPREISVKKAIEPKGLGLNWVRRVREGAPKNSKQPEDQLYSKRTVGHGSFSGCIFFVDLEQQLVITQVRKKFTKADDEWYARFFQTVAKAIGDSK